MTSDPQHPAAIVLTAWADDIDNALRSGGELNTRVLPRIFRDVAYALNKSLECDDRRFADEDTPRLPPLETDDGLGV